MNDPNQEVRMLIQELQQAQSLKSGSVERTQKEDYIFKRLYEIAEDIKTNRHRDPKAREIYKQIVGKEIPDQPSRLPVYTDEYKFFTEFPATPVTKNFLSRFENEQGLKSFVGKCDRTEVLEKSVCKNCWKEVMPQVFMMVIEMLTVELKQRAHQIRKMTEEGYLTQIDAEDLAKHMDKTIHESNKLLDKSIKHRHKKEEWSRLIESLFQLMVGLINEIMSRYMQFVMVKREVK